MPLIRRDRLHLPRPTAASVEAEVVLEHDRVIVAVLRPHEALPRRRHGAFFSRWRHDEPAVKVRSQRHVPEFGPRAVEPDLGVGEEREGMQAEVRGEPVVQPVGPEAAAAIDRVDLNQFTGQVDARPRQRKAVGRRRRIADGHVVRGRRWRRVAAQHRGSKWQNGQQQPSHGASGRASAVGHATLFR